MIRIHLLLLLCSVSLFAKVHYAKVEPFEEITLKSAVSAQVVMTQRNLEGTTVTNKRIIQLDQKMDHIELKSSQKGLKLLKKMSHINQKILLSLKESLQRQEAYYQRIKDLSSASLTQKDNAFYGYINTKNQYLSTQEKIDTLKKQQLDLEYKIALLQDRIQKKEIRIKNKFLYKILVNQGDFVNAGTPLAKVKDLTRAKLVLFLEQDELKDLPKKTIYINDKPTQYKINKRWLVSDEKFISSYRAEIYIKPHNNFSKLLKVELK